MDKRRTTTHAALGKKRLGCWFGWGAKRRILARGESAWRKTILGSDAHLNRKKDWSWRILQQKLWFARRRINEISSKCLHNLLLSEARIHRNNESPLISTHLRPPNVFLYSIFFLLLVAGYLVLTHVIFVSWVSSELQTEFERVKPLMIPSYMIELQKLLDSDRSCRIPKKFFGFFRKQMINHLLLTFRE